MDDVSLHLMLYTYYYHPIGCDAQKRGNLVQTRDLVALSGAPRIRNLISLRFRGAPDYVHMHAVLEAHSPAHDLQKSNTAEPGSLNSMPAWRIAECKPKGVVA
jgi:hypothetical protein